MGRKNELYGYDPYDPTLAMGTALFAMLGFLVSVYVRFFSSPQVTPGGSFLLFSRLYFSPWH